MLMKMIFQLLRNTQKVNKNFMNKFQKFCLAKILIKYSNIWVKEIMEEKHVRFVREFQ